MGSNKLQEIMKTKIAAILLLNTLFGFSQSEIENYSTFLKNQKQSPKEYIFELFETNNIIILGERDHRDTTQYDLILDIIRDERFINNVGHVYTEVGVVNQTKWANNVVKGNYKDTQEFEKEFVKLYRELDFNPLWDKYNMIKYLQGIYEINKNRTQDKKVTIGLTDCAFEWKDLTHKKYEEFKKNNLRGLNTRDSIMAFNFMKLYEQQNPINGHKKALLIQSRPHAINLNIVYKEKNIITTGGFIKKKYGNNVKVIAFNWYKWIPKEWKGVRWGLEHIIELTNDGKWDAAFEITENKSVGFDIKDTPFGLTEFDYSYEQNINFQDVIDGVIFYLPFYEFSCTRGLPNIVDIEFAEKYIERMDSINGNTSYSEKYTPKDEKMDWDEFRSFDCNDYEKMKIQMEQWIKD